MIYHAKRSRRLALNGIALLAAAVAACAPGEPIGPSAPLAPPTSPTPRADTVLVVYPKSATSDVATPIQFTAYQKVGTDSVSAAGDAEWSASGGAVSTTGSFQSPQTGSFYVYARSRRTGRRDSSVVSVTTTTTPTVTRISILPDSLTIAPGQSQTFAASALLSSGTSSAASVVWSSTGGTITSAGVFTAGATAGRFAVIAVQSGGTLADTSVVTVAVATPAVTLSSVVVTPATAAILTGATQQFSAVGRMSDGSTQPVTVTWSASSGSVSSSGLLTAPTTAGSVRVIAAEAGGKADTSVVTVTAPAPTLTRLTVSPVAASVVTGASQTFSATALWSDGSTTSPALTWSATGGTITAGGVYTAGSTTGTYRVVVQQTNGTVADTAAVSVTAPAPVTLTTLVLNPATVALATGATQQFTVAGSWSDGSATVPPVTYVATGGTVTAGGLYTAGATAGSYRMIATHQGGTKADTSAITINAAITAVEVTPATATVAAGATQQFTAVARLSTGGTQAITVTWSATGGTSSTGGVYTAGTTAGTYSVIAVQQGGTKADTAVVTVTANTTSATVANPSVLPVAGGQLPDFAAYEALGVRGAAAGTSYADPVTGVRVWKLSDAQTPAANSFVIHDYSGGPAQISREWGNRQHTLLVYAAGSGYWLADFQRGTGVSNWRRAPSGTTSLGLTFSNNPATPQIAYYLTSNVLRRFNTATMRDEPAGNFPRTIGSVSQQMVWLQTDKQDAWFVLQPAAGGTSTAFAWNSQTNQELTQTVAGGLDEQYLDRDGRYSFVSDGGGNIRVWTLATNVLGGIQTSGSSHGGALRQLLMSNDASSASQPQWRFDAVTGTRTNILDTRQATSGGQHRGAQWVQNDADLPGGSLLKQWYALTTDDDGDAAPGTWTLASGTTYTTTVNFSPDYAKPTIGVQSVRLLRTDGTGFAGQLRKASGLADMTAGSFFWDAAAARLYVQMADGGTPSGRVAVRAPSAIHDAVAFVRADGSEVRLLAHTYLHGTTYESMPMATLSPDGKLAMFKSTMNRAGGRVDTFIAEVPIR